MEKCRSEEDLYVFEERLVPDKWNLFNTRFNGEKKKKITEIMEHFDDTL